MIAKTQEFVTFLLNVILRDGWTERQTDRQSGGWAGGHAGWQASGRVDRRTDRPTDRHMAVPTDIPFVKYVVV